MARRYGVAPVASFPLFAQFWKAEMVYRESKSLRDALLRLTKERRKAGINYLLQTHYEESKRLDWKKIFRVVVADGDLEMAQFFFKRVEERDDYHRFFSLRQLYVILETAAEYGQTEIVNYFVESYRQRHLVPDRAFDIAVSNGRQDIAAKLIEAGVSDHVLFSSAVMALNSGHVALAEYLLQWDNEAKENRKGFLEFIWEDYDRELIFRYIDDVQDEYLTLFWHIVNDDDEEMVDYLAETKPELLLLLLSYIENVYDGGIEGAVAEDANEEEFLASVRTFHQYIKDRIV